MNRNWIILLTIFLSLVLLGACSRGEGESAAPDPDPNPVIPPQNPWDRGNRMLGITVSESELGFATSFEEALTAGIDVVEIKIPGNHMETTPGNYMDPYDGLLQETAPFINAFTNMIDWFIATVPENVTIPSISVGNAIDLVLEGQEDWDRYITFFQLTFRTPSRIPEPIFRGG